MSLDITSLVIKTESNGIDAAANSLNKLVEAADKAEKSSTKLSATNKTLNDSSKTLVPVLDSLLASYSRQENQLQQNITQSNAYANAMRSINSSQAAIVNSVSGLTSVMTQLSTVLSNMPARITAMTSTQRRSNEAMQEAHALARGLSGSLGALWVTYGNLAGMAAGLAIGQSLKSIVSIGRDVESTLESIRVRGNETTDSVNQMRQAISDLGKGVYGPQEVAKAFETLILAGLNANQALSAINSTMNLAVAGSTSIEKAASTLVSVGTSIGYVAEGYNRVGDVISKTAALSMSSVETLSEAFKSASSVASLYGVTLEDIGTSLGVLSNLGIQGSAAGTALKNMYKELNSEADKVQKTFKELGLTQLTFKDASGNFKPLLTVVQELDVALSKLSGNEEKLAIARLSNERGMRLITAALDQYRIKTAEGGNALAEFQENVNNSYGFMAKAAVQMSLTADNQMKMVVNSMKTGFADAFTTIQPEIISISTRLRETFQSESFKESLRFVALLFANIATTIAENIPVVVKLAEAFVALKFGMIAASVWQGIATAILAVREAMVATATASALLNASLGVVAAVVSVAAFAWMAYKTAQEDANKAQKDAADYSKGYIEGINKEAENLEKVNEKLREGIALKDVQKKVDADNSRMAMIERENAAVEEARNNLTKAQEAAMKYASQNNIEKMTKARQELAAAEEHQRQSAIAAYDAEFKLNLAAKENAELVLQAQKNAKGGRDEPTMSLVTEKNKAQGLSAIEAQLAALRLADEEQKRMILSEVKLYDEAYSNKKMTVFDYVAKSEDAYDRLGQQITKTYLKEANAILESRNLSTRTEAERNSLDKQRFDLAAKYTDDIVKNEEKRKKNSELLSSLAAKEFSAQEDANAKSIESTQKSIAAVEAKIFAYNRLPEALKKVGVTEKQLQDEMTQYSINSMKAEMEQLVENNNIADPLIKQRLEYLKQEIILKERLRDDQSELEKLQAANKAAQEYTTAWKQMNKQIGDDLASAIIDGGGKGWKKLINDMKMAFAKLILQPIIAPISAGIADLTTMVNPSSSAAAGSSGSVGLAGTAMNMYNMLSKGFAGIETSVTGMAQGILNHFGVASQYAGSGLPSTAAMGIGSIASTAAGIGGGLLLGNGISGQYGSNGTVMGGTAIGAIVGSLVPAIGTALGSFLGGTVGGLLNRAFGMGNKNISAQGISGTVADTGTTGISYSDWTQKGGWFRSDKSGRDSSALGADVINSFTSGLTTLKATSSDFAKSMNVSSDALKDYSKSFDIQFVGLKEVKGTAAEQAAIIQSNSKIQQEAITKFFTEMGDDMATKLIPNIQEFAKSGESASTTLQRLSETFTATTQVANILGKDVATAFGGVGLESAKARQYLVDLAGGTSALNSQVTSYATEFLTNAEKLAPVQKAVTTAMAELGYSGVTTKDQFKEVVSGLDLTTQSGAQTFEKLMQLAPAFATVANAAQEVTDKQKSLNMSLLEAKAAGEADSGGVAHMALLNAQRAEELDALAKLSPSLIATQKEIYAVVDANTARTKALEAEKSAAAIQIQILELQGRKEEALAITRKLEMDATSDADKAAKLRLYTLQDEATALAKSNATAQLNAQLLSLENNKAGSLAITRSIEMQGLSDTDKAIKQRIYVLEDEASAMAANNATSALQAKLLDAQNKHVDALNITRAIELSSLSGVNKEIQMRIYEIEDEKRLLAENNATSQLRAKVLDMENNKTLSLAITRGIELQGLSETDRTLKLRIFALEDEATALAVINTTSQLQAQILDLQNDKAGALAITRRIELQGLSDTDKALKIRIYQLQDEATLLQESNATAQLKAQILDLQNDKEGALAITRSIELQGLSDTDKALKLRIYALQDEATALAASNATATLNAKILELQKDKTGALAITRSIELQKLSEGDKVLQQRIYALEDEAAAAEVAAKTRNLEVSLLNELHRENDALVISRKAELATLSDTDKKIQQAIYDAQDRAKLATSSFAVLSKAITQAKDDNTAAYNATVASIEMSKNAATASYNAFKDSTNAAIKAAQDASAATTKLSDGLQSTLNAMLDNTELAISRASAKSMLASALETAKNTGVLPTADSMKDVFTALGKSDAGSFSSYTEYIKDLGITAGQVAQLKAISDNQTSASEQQVKLLQDSLTVAEQQYNATVTMYDAQSKAAKDLLDSQNTQLDSTLAKAQEQLDVMNGTNVAIVELSKALATYTAAVNTAIAAQKAYQIVSPEGASINGSHANGLDNVPFDGYTAKLHKGEMVLPSAQAKGVAQGDNIKEVVEKLQELCEATGAENRAMNSELVKIRKILVNVTPTNDRIQVHEVGAA